jgi:hypothetical protein
VQIERRDLIDWENIAMTIHASRELADHEIARLKQFLHDWPRMEAPGTKERETWPRPMWMQSDPKTIRFYWEKWFPTEWIEPLGRALEHVLPELVLLEIGHDYEPPFRDDNAFIHVPAKLVTFEDGTMTEVAPFEIAKYRVSIAQFSQFTDDTGYKTIAEQRNYETFRDNQFIGEIPEHKRGGLAAMGLSYRDSAAYCEWAKVRLPTEAEWVAAAVIDDRVFEDDDPEYGRVLEELRKRENALDHSWDERTGTVREGRFVVRSGPYLVRRRSDLTCVNYRQRYSLNFCEDPIAFRVCR